MRIAFDHQAFCLQKTGGISRYFFHLLEQLTLLNQTVKAFAPFYRNQYARQLPPSLVQGIFVNDYPPRCADAAVALNALIARRQLKRWQPTLTHETYFSTSRSGHANQPSVLTVFDMIGELGLDGIQPTLAQLRQSPKYAATARADHVICISEHTRQDLIRLYQVAPEKTSVIYLGCEAIPQFGLMPNNTNRPYLLYVGLRSGYKNFTRFLQAVASTTQLHSAFDIVAFGGGDFSAAERALIQSLNFKPQQVRQIGGNDTLLASYYGGASALVYPSCYEGFGLPPLEAMAYQCPVVSSHASAMPEVIGNAAEFFEPTDLSSIATAIQNVVLSPARAKELIAKGLERVAQFTWQTCAKKHVALYQGLTGPSLSDPSLGRPAPSHPSMNGQ
jgi:glycosyltransferase involved in cell wall biosynthesis